MTDTRRPATPPDGLDQARGSDEDAVLSGLPGMIGLDHVGVAVPDLDAAVDFHTRVLGLQLTHREVNEDQQVEEAMLTGPGSGQRPVQVQLLAPSGPGSTIARFIERTGPGLQQVAYRVADVEAAAAWLREQGVRVLYDDARRGTAGSRVNFLHPKDCGGVLVELVEMTSNPAQGSVPD